MKHLTLLTLLIPSVALADDYTSIVMAPYLDSLSAPKHEVYVPSYERPLDPVEKDYIRESTKTQELINERLRYERVQKPMDDALGNLFKSGAAERIR